MNPEQLLTHFDRISDAPAAVTRLRTIILDLAFTGRLVSQNAEEGTGAAVLRDTLRQQPENRRFGGRDRIDAAELLKCPPIMETPASWCWAYLDSLCAEISDVDHKMPKAVPEGVPFVSARDLKDDGSIDIENAKRICEEDFVRLSRKVQIRPGDIVYSRIGTIGKARLVKTDVRFIISYSCCLIRPIHGPIDVRFVQLFLESQIALNQAKHGTQGIGVPDLGLGEIKKFKVPLPPTLEQQRIVAKVNELMGLCDRLEAAQQERDGCRTRLTAASLARLNQPADAPQFREHVRFHLQHFPRFTTRPDQIPLLRQTILNLAVRGKLIPQYPSDEPASVLLDHIYMERCRSTSRNGVQKTSTRNVVDQDKRPFNPPSGWEWVELQDICQFENGDRSKNYPSGSDIVSAGIPFINTKNIIDNKVSLDNLDFISDEKFASLRSGKLKDRDILIVLRGSVGKLGVFEASSEFKTGFINAQLVILRNNCSEMVGYCLRYLISPVFQGLIVDQSSGSAQPQLSAGNLKTVPIPVPPLAEQHRIVAKVDELMLLCDQLEMQLTTTQTESRRLLEATLHKALAPALEHAV